MKTGILIVTLTSLIMTGCIRNPADEAKKDAERIVEEAKKRNQEIVEKNKDIIEQVITSLQQGGQPGRITVNGILVKHEGDEFILDERLNVEQFGGLSSDKKSRATVSDSSKAVFSEEVKDTNLGDASTSKTYINFGCDNLSESETKDLIEQTNVQSRERILDLSAKKIFVCGNHAFNKSLLYVNIRTSELILKSTAIVIEPAITGISLSAEKLYLEGDNVVESKGSDAPAAILPGPSIHLSLTREIHGEGKLTLRSIGGNNTSENQKVSDY